MFKVKICGITNKRDALSAIKLGADAIGFVFYEKSPRKISLANCKKIAGSIKPSILKVGVFVNEEKENVLKAIKKCHLNAVQFHGEESPTYCNYFKKHTVVIKAFRLKDKETLDKMKKYNVDAYLIDTYHPQKRGGTGKSFNLGLAREAAKLKRPLVISGGLKPSNVVFYLKAIKPDAVDVASGIEIRPGKKDLKKMKLFLGRVKSYVT